MVSSPALAFLFLRFFTEPTHAEEALVHGASFCSGGIGLHPHRDSVVRRDCSMSQNDKNISIVRNRKQI